MHQHSFKKSDKVGYEVCDCGSYHSIDQKDPNVIYVEEDYWSYDFGHSKVDEQVLNLNETEGTGISKIDIVLKYVPAHTKTVLEIGCCPGELLRRLVNLGYDCVGVEPATRHIDFISRQSMGAVIINGFFPQVYEDDAKELYDCIIFMDVFEHIEDYNSFIMAVHRLLKPKGIAICMSPIIFEDGLYRDRDFSPSEHCWIFSKEFLNPYLSSIFSKVIWDRWINGHEMFIATK